MKKKETTLLMSAVGKKGGFLKLFTIDILDLHDLVFLQFEFLY